MSMQTTIDVACRPLLMGMNIGECARLSDPAGHAKQCQTMFGKCFSISIFVVKSISFKIYRQGSL
jgi:hypothetical protein